MLQYIIPADVPFPSYHRQQNDLPKLKESWTALKNVDSQVLQTTIRRLHDTWEAFQARGHGFPRFLKFGQFKYACVSTVQDKSHCWGQHQSAEDWQCPHELVSSYS
ncbi:hypothetical protein [Microseira sp. BLCC-F43]|uniref:hypothetical protein n=1 Tax=Microseira sp. BLCC-F43 TaxID=3153602 RepID=UPI0035BAE690